MLTAEISRHEKTDRIFIYIRVCLMACGGLRVDERRSHSLLSIEIRADT
jgi:hypothetical protein